MSDIVSRFIDYVEISGNTLTVRTGSTILENHYDEKVEDTEYHTGTTYKGRYVYPDE